MRDRAKGSRTGKSFDTTAAAGAPELRVLHRWLDSWCGVGDVALGMYRVGWDLQLTEYGNGWWRATFWVTGDTHSVLGGSAYEGTAWGAVQRAAWEAVNSGVA